MRKLKNVSLQLISFAISAIASFIVTPILVRYVGQSLYGFVDLANTFSNYILIITSAFNTLLGRYVSLNYLKKEYNSAISYYSSITILNIVFSVLLIIFFTVLCIFLDKIINIPVDSITNVKLLFFFIFISFSISIMFCSFDVGTFVSNRMDLAGLKSISFTVLKYSSIFFLLKYISNDIYFVGIGTLFSMLINIIINFSMKKKLLPEIRLVKESFEINAIKNIFVVGVWNSLGQINQLLLNGLDLLLTNYFVGSLMMSIVSIGKTIPNQIILLISTVANTFVPNMIQKYSESKISLKKEIILQMKLCGFICSIPILGFVIYGDCFYHLWVGDLYKNNMIDISVVSILTLLSSLFSVYIYPLYNLFSVTCKLKIPTICNLGSGMINVIIVVAYLIFFGGENSIYIIVGCSSIISIIRILLFVPLYSSYILNVSWQFFYIPLIRGLASSVLISFLFITLKSMFIIDSWISLFFVAIVSALIGYLCSAMILFNKKDRIMCIQIVKEKLNV